MNMMQQGGPECSEPGCSRDGYYGRIVITGKGVVNQPTARGPWCILHVNNAPQTRLHPNAAQLKLFPSYE